ncbi:CDP-diacylglycerol--glycerol-3-phosphate 3-phosphatidyltransferase [Halorubrum aquaticum]|uniref:CDP-diacylglycerol--glycerol-3-phosphate 3-phosphatidyltransferase n=1 Tax=Halorubrum aquaticum TaxID=387340 RepID=A0A1I3CCE0_9EURY|nr:CDP-alcohol phosphatidyltransferase family protein [Halorubrum aquaticum]SFH71976.1 CDP-diacylglycerol--glycerol-3-phosphate 3-phosphatidyltransferase [Halorubrum aquaticum]
MAPTDRVVRRLPIDGGWVPLVTLWVVPTGFGAAGLLAVGLPGTALGGVALGGTVAIAAIRVAAGRSREAAGREPVTAATALTTLRASALALLGAYLVVDPSAGGSEWLAGGLFAVAAGGDAVDGAVARATDAVTELGAELDVEVDGATVLVGATAAVVAGAAPLAFLAVGLARPLFAYGLRRRRRRGLPTHDLRPSRLRRPIGAATMLATWLALSPVPDAGASRLLAAAVTVPVVVSFVRDWLVVSGRL